MKIGDIVNLETHYRLPRKGVITRVGIPSGLDDGLTAYEVMIEGVGDNLRFYMKPELYTNRHYNVGNRYCWITSDN